MTKRTTILLVILFLAFGFSDRSFAQTTNKKINIRVIDAVTGKPVENADINLKGLLFKQKRKTDSEGKALFEVFLIGTTLTLNLEIKDTSTRPHKDYKSTVTVYDRQDYYDVTASMQPDTKKISIRLSDATNNPLAEAKVTLTGNGNNQQSSVTDANGVVAFQIPPTDAYKNASLAVEKTGYEKTSVTLDVNDQTSQYSVIAPLKKETTELLKKEAAPIIVNTQPINSGMVDPTFNVDKTSAPVSAITRPDEGPYSPVCSGNPVAAVPSFSSWAVPPEKDVYDFLSDACIGSATQAVDALTTIMYDFESASKEQKRLNELYSKIKADQDKPNLPDAEREKLKAAMLKYLADGVKVYDKCKAVYDAMIKLTGGPELFIADCLLSGFSKYLDSQGGTPYATLKTTVTNVKNFTETQEELSLRLDDIDRRSKNQQIDYVKELKSMDWTAGFGRIKDAWTALNIISGFVADPKKLLSYKLQARIALGSAQDMLNDVITSCKLKACDAKLKEGIAAGQKGLTAARRNEKRVMGEMMKQGAMIDDFMHKVYTGNDSLSIKCRAWSFNRDYVTAMNGSQVGLDIKNYTKLEDEWKEAGKEVPPMDSILRELGKVCAKLQTAAATLNQRVETYKKLFADGTAAAENCNFKKAEIDLNQLKSMEASECGFFYPFANGIPMSNELQNKMNLWKDFSKCIPKEKLPNGATKYGPFAINSHGWISSGIQLKKGECFDAVATGVMYSKKDSTALHFGPDGGGYWVWWTLKAKIVEQRISIGSKGSGCAENDGELQFGTPTVNGFQQDAMDDLAGSFMVTVYVTHH